MKSIFVYGTLKPGHGRWHILEEYAVSYEKDATSGYMVSFGGYPGAIFTDCGRAPTIYGYCVKVEDPDFPIIMDLLDHVEGVSFGLFKRAEVETHKNGRVAAYEICCVPDGDWRPELDERNE